MLSFSKILFKSNLGLGRMHDKYITVPANCDPPSFFCQPPETIHFFDKNFKKSYHFKFKHENNGEYRLYRFGRFYDDNDAKVGDTIHIEKEITIDGIIYNIELQKKKPSSQQKKPSRVEYLSQKKSRGQGLNLSYPERRAVELYAMGIAKKHFESDGWIVSDTSATKPYDLQVKKNGHIKYVEVKGTTGEGKNVILTNGEVEHVKENPNNSVLLVVGHIKIKEVEPDQYIGINGEMLSLKDPWRINNEDLKPTQYRYII
tara:strand:- start:9 stop:785 length:777 start_codon:yes stop_codon:yes gene_type:complete